MIAKRKPGGRPKMPDGHRSKKITARFTEDEYKLVGELEKTLGVSKTDLVRMRLLDNAGAVVINAKELIQSVDDIGAEMGRCGNNINQLARHANILQKKGRLGPMVAEQFNSLLADYIRKQETLEVSLRRIIRAIGR